MKKVWLLFDDRYRTDEEAATCYEVCDTLKEAKKNAPEYGSGTVIVEADLDGCNLKNCKIIN